MSNETNETTVDYGADGVAVRLPDGRTLHVWHHHCAECTSVDVWLTTADGREHAVSANTGDRTRAPFGLFTFAGGARHEMASGADAGAEHCHGRAAQGTAVLVWRDEL